MKIELTIRKEFDVDTIAVSVGVRYWEDSTVNGDEDVKGDLIPCRDGDNWCPIIKLETGQITNWKQGVSANIHYKVCGDGVYELRDVDNNKIIEIEGDVPSIMCPNGEGFGDSIKMTIDKDGFIKKWECDLSYFDKNGND